jgi:hypothetical protein
MSHSNTFFDEETKDEDEDLDKEDCDFEGDDHENYEEQYVPGRDNN